ncbi:MAG: RNA polymerase sigma-70 factor [Cyclobacteriaceae bacterium]
MSFDRNIVIRNLRKGDENSFSIVFEEFHKPLVKFANSYLYDLAESQDLVQGVFVKIWEKCETLTIDGSIDAYLFTTVKNCCLNRLKSLQIEDKHNLLMLEGMLNYYKEHQRIDLNLEEHLRDAIQKLPDKIKEVILLKYSDNKKISEISAAMNISENTVKTQLQRGKSKLKEAISTIQNVVVFFLLTNQM